METSVDIALIERELRDLWQQMARPAQTEQQQAVTRACVMNLIVYAPGETADRDVTGILADVIYEHPARMIVLLPEGTGPEPLAQHSLSAWVTAQCRVAAGGRKQVCCEQIMIRAKGPVLKQLPSVVIRLLVPDLPVCLWWRDQLRETNDVLNALLKPADHIIVDSALFADPSREFERLAALIRANRGWTAFSDLNWSRLTPWRITIAECFDVAEYRSCFSRINAVHIGWNHHSQWMLLIGWLAGRLHWDPHWVNSMVHVSAGQVPYIRFVMDDGEVTVRQNSEGSHLETFLRAKDRQLVGRITKLSPGAEAASLNQELEILGSDHVFEEALEMILKYA